MTTDTPASVTELRAFGRDVLFAIRALERRDNPPKGLTIKQHLDTGAYEDVNHSRLYQNLDALATDGLIEKRERDGRTNEYTTTKRARTLLEAFARRRVDQTGVELDANATEQTNTDAMEQGAES